MKKLSIEEKAKRYDEAIERAKKVLLDCTQEEQKVVEYITPELKESEDKMMIKFIKQQLFNIKKTITENYELDAKLTKAIDWIEKQGGITKLSDEEQNKFAKCVLTSCALSFINYLDAHKYEDKMCVSNGECEDIENAFHNAMWDRLHRYYCKYIEKQGEQKPYGQREECLDCQFNYAGECKGSCAMKRGEQKPDWSEEDDYNLQCIIAKVTSDIQKGNIGRNNELIDWLKSLKDRVQPKQEWSKEDILMLDMAIASCEQYGNTNAAKWLNSIRPQSNTYHKGFEQGFKKARNMGYGHWKPSDEQIEALESATKNCAYSEYQDCLRELIGQLKKLREE